MARCGTKGLLGAVVGSGCLVMASQSLAAQGQTEQNPLRLFPDTTAYVVGVPVSGLRTADFEPSSDAGPGVKAAHAEERFYRDSEGRTRAEFRHGNSKWTYYILDPLLKQQITWADGWTDVAVTTVVPPTKSVAEAPPDAADVPHYRVIDGVATHGMERPHPVGDTPAERTLESWYSPALHLELLNVIEVPGHGRSTYGFHNLVRNEPDPALFRAPPGMPIRGSAPSPVAPSGLPHSIADDKFSAAMGRFDRSLEKFEDAPPYHRHVEIRMLGLKGAQSTATLDEWRVKRTETRIEERGPEWERTITSTGGSTWMKEVGTPPLRVWQIRIIGSWPEPAERRLISDAKNLPRLKFENKIGKDLTCAEKYNSAMLCFDIPTGLISVAAWDGETYVYDQWKEWSGHPGKLYPGRIQIMRGNRLQMEATQTLTADTDHGADFFKHPDGAKKLGPNQPPEHPVLHRASLQTQIYGSAMVKIWVDTKGRVKKAQLQDADDPYLGSAALDAARATLFEPVDNNGHYEPFATWLFYFSSSP